MFLKTLLNRKFLFSLVFIVGICLAFYYLLARNVKKSVTQSILQRQQLLVRAESSNIKSFFQVFGDSIAVLSQLPSIEKMDSGTERDLDIFVEQWRDSEIVSGIVLIDSRGVVQFNSNVIGTHDVGVSLSDRDYFIWAMSQPHVSEYFIGQPVVSRLGASKGSLIVPVATAIYRNNDFKGVLVASVRLNSLADHYLELMKVSDTTEVYLIDQNGDLLYSDVVDGILTTDKMFLSFLRNILSEKKDGNFQSDKRLLAHSNVELGDQDWLLVMATPTNEISNFTAPIFIRLTIMAVLVIVTILLYGYINTKETRRLVSIPED